MNNISFADPRLLWVGLPLLLLVLVPFLISVRKGNRNLHNVGGFCCHLIVVIAATLAFAGLRYDAMITETNVYVLADVSHSSSNNLDVLDGYIRDVEDQLPRNSRMGVIAFGRDYRMLSDLGEELVSVRTAFESVNGLAPVDDSATDIASALRYAGNLFEEDVIKRVVIITDGNETDKDGKLPALTAKLADEGVYVDVVYLNNNIAEDVRELQMTDVSYVGSTFVGREETADLTIQSNNPTPTRVYIDVTCGGKTVSYAETLYKGQNPVSVPLATEEIGTYEYAVTVRPDKAEDDSSPYNNTCLFTQTVSGKVRVLFLGGSYEDCAAGRDIYGTEDVTYIMEPDEVPFTVEALCAYDEIVLCNFDVRQMLSRQQFVANLDTVVSKFGKTLTTYGNTFVQEIQAAEPSADGSLGEDYEILKELGGMLPVTMGNPDQDGRLVVLLLDISTSMNFVSRLAVARASAAKLMESLNENDTVMLIGYAGDIRILHAATYLNDKGREEVLDAISSYQPRNGTLLKDAMRYARDEIAAQRFHHRELIIISDGLFHSDNEQDCMELAEQMSENNVVISALGIYPTDDNAAPFLRNLVENRNANGKGYYKSIMSESDVDYVLGEVAERLTEVCIEGDNYVLTLRRPQDDVLAGVGSLPAIQGFWYSDNKVGATSVVTAKYYRDKLYSLDVPIYSYWSYGNGRVACFLSDISASSAWLQTWRTDNEKTFFANIRGSMLPDERIESPFILEVEAVGNIAQVSVTTDSFHKDAKLTMTLTAPDGTVTTQVMSFDSQKYVCSFDAREEGRYSLHLVCDYGLSHYEEDRGFAISYYPEYDSFAPCQVASLYRAVNQKGEVSLDGKLKMDNSDAATRTYTFDFRIPLMTACVVLFVLSIIIRLIRWKDIRSLFVHVRPRGERRS